MNVASRIAMLAALDLAGTSPAQARDATREPTDVTIRRLAGLPAATARGQIEIVDVGHNPTDTMLSIVGNRTGKGWAVSYACASSLMCAPAADHKASSYLLSPSDAAEVDSILDRLRNGREPDGQLPSADIIGGYLVVSIDDRGFKRQYRRVVTWGQTLGRLEALLIR